MADNENKSIEEQKNQVPPLFSFFQNILSNFPQFKKENNNKEEASVVVVKEGTNKIVEESKPEKPDFVKLPDAKQDFSSLKLTVEESEQAGSGSHLWQVYALGAFMILKWGWARWKESKAKKTDKPGSGDEEPSHADDS